MSITKDIEIEELVEKIPASVSYLSKKGIRCIMCGEPIWGTLEEAAREKGFSDEEIDVFVSEINELGKKGESPRPADLSRKINPLDISE
ncbi:MAG: hypothetical protein J7K46_07280 [Bacteroidales bacterium]|nr:hypothetical protein [Bacteroidales bacterium]